MFSENNEHSFDIVFTINQIYQIEEGAQEELFSPDDFRPQTHNTT